MLVKVVLMQLWKSSLCTEKVLIMFTAVVYFKQGCCITTKPRGITNMLKLGSYKSEFMCSR